MEVMLQEAQEVVAMEQEVQDPLMLELQILVVEVEVIQALQERSLEVQVVQELLF
jgi:hypothetical protein